MLLPRDLQAFRRKPPPSGGPAPVSGRGPASTVWSGTAGGLRPVGRFGRPWNRLDRALARLSRPELAAPAEARKSAADPAGAREEPVASDARGASDLLAESAANERRALPRRDSGCSVRICVVPGDEPVTSQRVEWLLRASQECGPMVDVSLRSVSLTLGEPLASGARVMLRLTNPRLAQEIDRGARVVRSVAQGAGEWKIVCRFDDPLALAELQHFARYPLGSGCV